jgi:anti-sigma-K factor RskA
MSEPISPEKQQELAAGYVMDDLSPEEREMLDRLFQESPSLPQNLRLLQETFGAIPCNLTLTSPPAALKNKLFAEIAAETEQESPVRATQLDQARNSSSSWQRQILLFLAALGAIALIVDNWRLRQALQFAQTAGQNDAEAVATIMERGNSRRLIPAKPASPACR